MKLGGLSEEPRVPCLYLPRRLSLTFKCVSIQTVIATNGSPRAVVKKHGKAVLQLNDADALALALASHTLIFQL